MLLYEFASFILNCLMMEFNSLGLNWENESEKADLTNETF